DQDRRPLVRLAALTAREAVSERVAAVVPALPMGHPAAWVAPKDLVRVIPRRPVENVRSGMDSEIDVHIGEARQEAFHASVLEGVFDRRGIEVSVERQPVARLGDPVWWRIAVLVPRRAAVDN